MNKPKAKKYGVYYVSHGKWIGPYLGKTFSQSAINRNPFKSDIKVLKNRILKSRVKLVLTK